MLSPEHFAQVVRLTPLISIDLIIWDPKGCVLVGLRTTEPAKGTYFVPGGVIRKNEMLTQAFARILKAETGLDVPMSAARLLGAFQHFYDTNRFGESGYGTHYVVLGYDLKLNHRPDVRLDDQHETFRWMTPAEILSVPEVHENTRAYFG